MKGKSVIFSLSLCLSLSLSLLFRLHVSVMNCLPCRVFLTLHSSDFYLSGHVGLHQIVQHGLETGQGRLFQTIQHNGIHIVNVVLPGRGGLTYLYSLSKKNVHNDNIMNKIEPLKFLGFIYRVSINTPLPLPQIFMKNNSNSIKTT